MCIYLQKYQHSMKSKIIVYSRSMEIIIIFPPFYLVKEKHRYYHIYTIKLFSGQK